MTKNNCNDKNKKHAYLFRLTEQDGVGRHIILGLEPYMTHHHLCLPSRPDLIEFHKLTRSNATHNLQQAFNIAEQQLGLTKLLDPEGKNVQPVLG